MFSIQPDTNKVIYIFTLLRETTCTTSLFFITWLIYTLVLSSSMISSMMPRNCDESCLESSSRYWLCSDTLRDKPPSCHLTSKRRMWSVTSWLCRVTNMNELSKIIYFQWTRQRDTINSKKIFLVLAWLCITLSSLCKDCNRLSFSFWMGDELSTSWPAWRWVNTRFTQTLRLPVSRLMNIELWISFYK